MIFCFTHHLALNSSSVKFWRQTKLSIKRASGSGAAWQVQEQLPIWHNIRSMKIILLKRPFQRNLRLNFYL